MVELRVELYGHLVGHLIGTDWRAFDFRTDRSAFDYFDLGSTVLSESVPLDVVQNRARAARRRNFFSELLPEGRILTNLANSIRVGEHDIIPLLAHYGRDVAGAIQIVDPDVPGEPRTPRTTGLSERGVRDLLLNTQLTPLGNSPVTGKSSLAGMQDKIVLAFIDGGWHQVHDGYPSTHIVKTESRDYPTVIFDEEYGARIARAAQLTGHSTYLHEFSGVPGLVIDRYDRSSDAPQGRIHQEDMSQALGAHGNEKYQEFGGKVSLHRIADLFRKNGDSESLSRLLKLNTVSVAVGNLDLHAKNISILHLPDSSSTLAPAYDIVPMIHQTNDGKMSLAVNGRYRHAEITATDIADEARGWGMRAPENLIAETLEAVAGLVDAEAPHPGAYESLSENIRGFTRNLLAGKPAAGPR
ncbi:MAG: type II toxin-antitoxin system HipA family toxin [Lacisediminihabitans sp.]